MVGELPPGWVQIDFEQDTPYGMFRDALVFPDGIVPPLEELELMKQQRVNNWIAVVSNPPQPPVQGDING